MLEKESSLSSSPPSGDGGFGKRKVMKNFKYEEKTQPSSKIRQTSSLELCDGSSDSSDGEMIPPVPQSFKQKTQPSLNSTSTPNRNRWLNKTLTAEDSAEEPYTFQSLYNTLKRMEGSCLSPPLHICIYY